MAVEIRITDELSRTAVVVALYDAAVWVDDGLWDRLNEAGSLTIDGVAGFEYDGEWRAIADTDADLDVLVGIRQDLVRVAAVELGSVVELVTDRERIRSGLEGCVHSIAELQGPILNRPREEMERLVAIHDAAARLAAELTLAEVA
jgi:hypothetical protein